MGPREAYDAILRALARSAQRRVVESYFDEQHFGNFAITFRDGAQLMTVINDRDYVTVAPGDGAGQESATLPSLYDADEPTLLQALSL